MSKLVILSGPSCVGKGPLVEAVKRHYPDQKFAQPVLCHSRPPRWKKADERWEIHGADYYFFPIAFLKSLDPETFIVDRIRSEIQALDLVRMRMLLEENELVFTEAYPTLAIPLMKWASEAQIAGLELRSVFLAPLSFEEISERARKQGVCDEELLYRVMKAKLERRGEDAPGKIEERARSAWFEMKRWMNQYTDVIVNSAGEDAAEDWRDPLSPAAEKTMKRFAAILKP